MMVMVKIITKMEMTMMWWKRRMLSRERRIVRRRSRMTIRKKITTMIDKEGENSKEDGEEEQS